MSDGPEVQAGVVAEAVAVLPGVALFGTVAVGPLMVGALVGGATVVGAAVEDGTVSDGTPPSRPPQASVVGVAVPVPGFCSDTTGDGRTAVVLALGVDDGSVAVDCSPRGTVVHTTVVGVGRSVLLSATPPPA